MEQYRRDIDGLRGFSIIVVVLYHAFPNFFENGYVGVDIFFVISGYLISSITLRELEQNNFSILNFYLRRVKRIFPVALLVLVFSTAIALLTLTHSEFSKFKDSLKAAILFYTNYQLEFEAGYFNVSSQLKPLMHYWSLAVEEQFYFAWPVLLFLTAKAKSKNLLNFIIGAVGAASFLWFIYSNIVLDHNSTGNFYYSLEVRLWEILAGVGITFCQAGHRFRQKLLQANERLFFNPSFVGLLFILVALVVPSRVGPSFFAVSGAVCIILNNRNTFFAKFLTSNIMVKLGLMSYSLYLWHWPFLSFLRIYKADVGESVRMIAVAVAIVFSFITYTLIEKPLKAQSWSVRKSEKVFQSFGVGQAAVLLTCYLILLSIQFFIRPGNLSDPEHLSDIKPRLYATPSCLLERIDKDYVPKSMRFCNSSAASVSKQGLIVGDSHANVVMDGIVQVSKNMTWHLVAHNSCLPYLGETNNGEVDCGNYMAKAIRFAIAEHYSYIIFSVANNTFQSMVRLQGLAMIRETFIKELQWMNAKEGIPKLIIIDPSPEFRIHPTGCARSRPDFIQQYISSISYLCELKTSDWFQTSKVLRDLYLDLKSEFPKVELIEPTKSVCSGAICRSGPYFYSDNTHLSFQSSIKLATYLNENIFLK